MDIGELLKVFMSTKETKQVNNQSIPQEVINQYPYGEFPIRYTKLGQEQIRKSSENRFSYEDKHNDTDNSIKSEFDIMSLIPIISLMSNKKQPKEMFELLSSFIFKDKPELKKLLNLFPKPQNQEHVTEKNFPDTNKISISSLKRIN